MSLSLLAAACAAPGARETAESSLVAAERAFAQQSADLGIRAAFLANFADDGIAFEPAPVRLRETWGARPVPADPHALGLGWAPAIAGVSLAGDLGYTSGPFVLAPRDGRRPPQHGVYFSLWRRTAGMWKVALDAGIVTPAPVSADALQPPLPMGAAPEAAARIDNVRALEGAVRTGADIVRLLANDGRLQRDGDPPLIGRAAVTERVPLTLALSLSAQGGGEAESGDLAYTYGEAQSDGRRGYYAHVWTRGPTGAWQLAVAIWYDAPA